MGARSTSPSFLPYPLPLLPLLPLLLVLPALLMGVPGAPVGAAGASAQEIAVRATASPDPAALSPGSDFTVALVVEPGDGAPAVASLSLRIHWDGGLLEYLGVDAGSFGSLTVNDADAALGLLRLAAYSVEGTASAFELARLHFRTAGSIGAPGGAVTSLPLHVEVTAVGDEAGASVADAATAAGCVLCMADLLGDVNGDGAVDIIDAQQIARQAVGLGVTDALRFPDYADVNADVSADILDAQQIARCAAGLDVGGDWCDVDSCDDLAAIDGIALDASEISLAAGESRQLAARSYRDGVWVPWPAGARAAWGWVDPAGAVSATVAGDSAFTLEGVVDGEGRLTASLGAGVSPAALFRVGDPPPSEFHLELRYLSSVTGAQQAALEAAAARWMDVIVGDIPDHPLIVAASSCHPALDEVVDDMVIFVEIVAMDGVGGVLGSAGPCYYRTASGLPITGLVSLDAADVDAMLGDGSFGDVIVHEIGHVLGLGTLWTTHGLLQGEGGADPYFDGAAALARFDDAGGTGYGGPAVPVENTGGAGTRDGHWRESVFDNELMTGWVNVGFNPLSAITIGSFEDMGYVVDYGVAESYHLPGLSILGFGTARRELRETLLRAPAAVGTDGRPTGNRPVEAGPGPR